MAGGVDVLSGEHVAGIKLGREWQSLEVGELTGYLKDNAAKVIGQIESALSGRRQITLVLLLKAERDLYRPFDLE